MVQIIVPIEGNGRFVLGVDDQRKDRGLGACCPRGSIHDERAAEPLAAKLAIDSETADVAGGQERVVRQAFRDVGGSF